MEETNENSNNLELRETQSERIIRRRRNSEYKNINNELRAQLIEMNIMRFMDLKETCNILNINYKSGWRIINAYKKSGNILKKKKGGSSTRILTPEILSQIEALVSQDGEMTLKEIKNELERANTGFQIALSTVDLGLEKLMITVKRPHKELDKVNEGGSINLRKEYAIWFNTKFYSGYDNVIFVDESPFNLHLRRNQARSVRGKRANIRVPTVRGRSITLISSIGINGIVYSKVIENSTVNAAIFAEYIRELCIQLRDVKGLKNVCIIMDNARIHRGRDLESILGEFNYEFKFLSFYSYMLNPIEKAFSKIKNATKELLRSNQGGIFKELILQAVNNVNLSDCYGFFRNMTSNLVNSAAGLPYNHQ